MAGEELVGSGLVRRRLLRRLAHVLLFILSRHPDLPVLTWTVTADVLRGHVDVCDLDPGYDRRVFSVWAEALPAAVVDSRGRLDGVSRMGPPLSVIETEEEHGVILRALFIVGSGWLRRGAERGWPARSWSLTVGSSAAWPGL